MPGDMATVASMRATTPADNVIAEKLQRIRDAVIHAVTDDDVREAMKAQVAKAKKGDGKALQLVLGLVAGCAPPTPEPRVRRIQPKAVPQLPAHGGKE